jgi:hypothetical protein
VAWIWGRAPSCSGEKFELRRERLNQGGYDRDGEYFGRGLPLYRYANGDSWGELRAETREAAIAEIRKVCPNAVFLREVTGRSPSAQRKKRAKMSPAELVAHDAKEEGRSPAEIRAILEQRDLKGSRRRRR